MRFVTLLLLLAGCGRLGFEAVDSECVGSDCIDGSEIDAGPGEPNDVYPAVPGGAYFVSPLGDDSKNGLSSDSAWKTFTHAWTVLAPGDTLVLEDGVALGFSAGSWLSASAMFGAPTRSKSAMPTTVTGVGVSKPVRAICEPVTMMSSLSSLASCAKAATGMAASAVSNVVASSIDARPRRVRNLNAPIRMRIPLID